MSDESPEAASSTGSSSAAVAGSSRRHSALVGAGIFLSRISGLIRERAMAHFFATGFIADAFTAAFRIPNLLQNLLGEGVLSASFIPVYSRLLAAGREEEAGRVAGAIAGLLTVVAGGLVLLGVLFARPLTLLITPGLPAETLDLTVQLTRIIFPGIGLLVLSAWCLGVLNSHRRFFLSYVAPVLWNGAQIAVLVVLGVTVYEGASAGAGEESLGLVRALAWGTVAGGALQFLVQLPGVVRVTRGLRPSVRTDLPGVRRAVRAFGPVVAGRGVVQLSAYVDVFLASFLAVGALSALRYTQTLYVLPISLFGMSVAAAELPALSSMDHDDRVSLAARLDAGQARIAFFVLPTVAGFLVIGDLIVATVFQSGQFVRVDVLQVWIILAAYTIGLLASTSSRLLQSALYGIGDTRRPAIIAAVRVAVSVVLGVLLMFQLDRVAVETTGLRVAGDLPAFEPVAAALRQPQTAGDVTRLGAAGLALAAGLTSWLEYLWLRRHVAHELGPTRLGGGHLGRTLVATTAAAAVALASRPLVAELAPLVAGPVAVVLTAAVYGLAAYALRLPEVHEVADALRRRLRAR